MDQPLFLLALALSASSLVGTPNAAPAMRQDCEPSWLASFGPSSGQASLTSLVVFDDGSGPGPALYGSGSFVAPGGATTIGVARWDGTAWSILGAGMMGLTGATAVVTALAVYDAGAGPMLYAGGEFVRVGTVTATNIARWDGTSWTGLGPSGPSGRMR